MRKDDWAKRSLFYKSDNYFRNLTSLKEGIQFWSSQECIFNTFQDHYDRIFGAVVKPNYLNCDSNQQIMIQTQSRHQYEFKYTISKEYFIRVRRVQTVYDVLSYLGGLSLGIRLILRLFGAVFSEISMEAKLIKQLYFTYEPNILAKDLKSIANHSQFSLYMKYQLIRIGNISQFKYRFCGRKRRTSMENLAQKTHRRLKQDLDFLALVDTVYKIKASLKMLIGGDKNLLRRIKLEYIRMKKIDVESSSEDEKPSIFDRNTFHDFLKEDTLFEIQHELQIKNLKREVFNALKPTEKRERPISTNHENMFSINQLTDSSFKTVNQGNLNQSSFLSVKSFGYQKTTGTMSKRHSDEQLFHPHNI